MDTISRAQLVASEILHNDPIQISAKLAHTKVVIGIDSSLAKTRIGQMGLVTVTNIICRLGALIPGLYLDVPPGITVLEGIPLLPAGKQLDECLLELTQRLAQIHNVELTRSLCDRSKSYDYGIFIGSTTATTKQSVVIGAQRWLAIVRTDGQPEKVCTKDPNPLGMLLAAGLGSAEIIKRMWLSIDECLIKLKIKPIDKRVVVSAYDFSLNPTSPKNPSMSGCCELGHACVFGLGATGSACMYTLGCLPNLKMSIDLVDMDHIELTNEERLFTSSNPTTDVGQHKVIHAEHFIQCLHRKVHAFSYPTLFEHFVDAARDRLGYVMCCLDNITCRRELPLELSSTTANGGTDSSRWMVSFHEFDRPTNACLRDLYPQSKNELFDAQRELARILGINIARIRQIEQGGIKLPPALIQRALVRNRDPKIRQLLHQLQAQTYNQAIAQVCSTLTPVKSMPAATISFVSILPAIGMTADLVKRRIYNWKPQPNEPNVFVFDSMDHLSEARAFRLVASPDCICQSKEYRRAFETRQQFRKKFLGQFFWERAAVDPKTMQNQQNVRNIVQIKPPAAIVQPPQALPNYIRPQPIPILKGWRGFICRTCAVCLEILGCIGYLGLLSLTLTLMHLLTRPEVSTYHVWQVWKLCSLATTVHISVNTWLRYTASSIMPFVVFWGAMYLTMRARKTAAILYRKASEMNGPKKRERIFSFLMTSYALITVPLMWISGITIFIIHVRCVMPQTKCFWPLLFFPCFLQFFLAIFGMVYLALIPFAIIEKLRKKVLN